MAGKRRYLKVQNSCVIEQSVKNGRRTFKCKGLRRPPTAQEIVESLSK